MDEIPPDIGAPPPARTAVRRLTLGEEEAGQRLDKVLTRLLPEVPRSHVFRLLRKGEVRVNGKRASADLRLAAGDELRNAWTGVRLHLGASSIRCRAGGAATDITGQL